MPRENAVLHLLLRMLALGLSAWEMIDSQEFSEPKLDSRLVTRFIPSMMSLIVDDHVRGVNAKLPPDERDSAHIVIEHSGPPPEACQVSRCHTLWKNVTQYYLSAAHIFRSTAFYREQPGGCGVGHALHFTNSQGERQNRRDEDSWYPG